MFFLQLWKHKYPKITLKSNLNETKDVKVNHKNRTGVKVLKYLKLNVSKVNNIYIHMFVDKMN